MKFVPAQDYWFYLPSLSSPDKAEKMFLHNQGEFSDYKELAFRKHLNKLSSLTKFFAHCNGSRISKVLEQEPLWLGRRGLEELIGKR